MSRLIFRLTAEGVLGGVFLLFGIWYVGYRDTAPFSDTVPAYVGWILIVIAALLFGHVAIAAALGKLRTPPDAGVGFRVPGTPPRGEGGDDPRNTRPAGDT
ncbi:tetraspanin family protein [Corynebacterium halotolerans]|uniref:Uncharacterized protein n=1 Tax=Corynebacterium halotolerans YIM 70093 = DSM 44683 TaxID=1121362 RepID=M1MVA1_9CORY|nr:tetraspanin family protein [Corynebacterium halotolerans]AGF71649.1 hypothetical protein A605_03180 [Corynebacterium halotolerans YIM 70093 = DSM 44683]